MLREVKRVSSKMLPEASRISARNQVLSVAPFKVRATLESVPSVQAVKELAITAP